MKNSNTHCSIKTATLSGGICAQPVVESSVELSQL